MKHFDEWEDGYAYINERVVVAGGDGNVHEASVVRDDGDGKYTVFAGADDEIVVELDGVSDLDEWYESLAVRSYRVIGE